MAGLRNSRKCASLEAEGQHNEAVLPFDEISHEIYNNFLSIRVPKDIGQIQAVHGNGNGLGTAPSNSVRVNCADFSDRKCTEECSKLNVIPNKKPPKNKPEEESLFLRSKRKYLRRTDEIYHSLEIELKAPRNYRPLPDPGPPPPIITIVSKAKTDGKGKKGKKKK